MILIDGYNLLHAIGIAERAIGPGTLERARNALLRFLALSLDTDERLITTIVFDSNDAPPGLPRELEHQGITVLYATDHESADELLEELIQAAKAPRRMTVVSSDHRVQRAAKRRRARAVDSEFWYEEIQAATCKSPEPPNAPSPKPSQPLTDDEVAHWLDAFGDINIDIDEPTTQNQTQDEHNASPIENPFPPGYGEDLLDDS